MTTVHVTTANICGNPLRIKRAVRSRMQRALRRPGAVLGQEIARSNRWRSGNYSAMWHNISTAWDKKAYGGPREVPVSIPSAWDVVRAETIKVHNGLAHVSPDRFMTVVEVEIGDESVAFVNCHPVSKPRLGVYKATWRIEHWHLYIDRLREQVADLHEAGFTVVFGGDMNRRKVPFIHPAQRTLIESGLDHLWIAPAGVKVSNVHTSRVGRTVLMDHPILTAAFDISR